VIDLISTHDGVDEQTRNEAHLLAAVIALALQDICMVPSDEEIRYQQNISRKSIDALTFFYSPRSMFRTYSLMIGLNPEVFVEAMEKRTFENESYKRNKNPFFSHNDVKAMRMRINWWHLNPVQSRQLQLEL